MSKPNKDIEKTEVDNANDIIHKQQFGVLLRQAREEKNISVLEVAEGLRLTEANINALENSQIDELPGKAFTLGYIRSYSRYLEIDNKVISDTYLEFYDQEEISLHSTSDKKISTPKFDQRFIFIAVILFAVLGLFIFSSDSQDKNKSAEIMNDAAQQEEININNEDDGVFKKKINEINIPIEKSSIKDQSKHFTIEPKKISKLKLIKNSKFVLNKEPTVLKITNKHQDTLQIHVVADSWAEIEDGKGERLFYETLKIGEDYQFKGQSPFKIFLGNAPAVNLSVNHQKVDFKSHIKPNNVAHLIINETAVIE